MISRFLLAISSTMHVNLLFAQNISASYTNQALTPIFAPSANGLCLCPHQIHWSILWTAEAWALLVVHVPIYFCYFLSQDILNPQWNITLNTVCNINDIEWCSRLKGLIDLFLNFLLFKSSKVFKLTFTKIIFGAPFNFLDIIPAW